MPKIKQFYTYIILNFCLYEKITRKQRSSCHKIHKNGGAEAEASEEHWIIHLSDERSIELFFIFQNIQRVAHLVQLFKLSNEENFLATIMDS